MSDPSTILLVLDTAGPACACGIFRLAETGDKSVAHHSEPMATGHAERLVPMVGEVLAEAGIGLADLDRIAVTTGPGSFTGVRIGIAAARGLALASERPVVGVPSLAAIALTAFGACGPDDSLNDRPGAVVMDARRGEVLVQRFCSPHKPDGAPVLVALDTVSDALADPIKWLVGTGAYHVRDHIKDSVAVFDIAVPDLLSVARLAARETAPKAPTPLYARPPDAKPQTAQLTFAR